MRVPQFVLGTGLLYGLLGSPLPGRGELVPAAQSTDPQSDLERGLALFQQRRFADAAQALEKVRRDPALRTEVLLLLGICYYRQADLSRAEPLLQQVVREGDAEEQASARVFLGLLFQEQGAVDQARSELGRVVGTPTLRDSAQLLLSQSRPHRLLFTIMLSPEFDGNVPLTDYATWSANPTTSSDGDMLFLGSVSARPFSFGLHLGNTLSYRQQFQQTAYNLLLNSTWLGYNYLGSADRFRVTTTFHYALLGDSTLYLDGDAKLSYRRRLRGKLGLTLSYHGHYRDYRNPDFLSLSGYFQTLQTELGFGISPQPVSAGLGYQAVREQTRPPDAEDALSYDYRAWAHGPLAWLRARLHQRVELMVYALFLHRVFDAIPDPSAEDSARRVDLALHTDLSLNFHLTSWLDLFVGNTLIYNHSNKAPFLYFKPTANLGLAGYFGVL